MSSDLVETSRVPATEHVINLVKATLQGIPLGGFVASLIDDYVPKHTEKSIQRTLELLAERLTELNERLDGASIDQDEFAELFKNCVQVMVRTHAEEKLRGAANAIANLSLKDGEEDKLPYSELDFFTRCLQDLSTESIRVLAIGLKQHPNHNWKAFEHRNPTITFRNLRLAFDPKIDSDMLLGFVCELMRFNLLLPQSAPNVRAEGYDNFPIELTRLGHRFIRYIVNAGT